MKERFSGLDIPLITKELQNSITGYRLTNIYNIGDSTRQFLLKFNKPDSKFNVIVDCGFKIYVTQFTRPIPPQPSGFVVKLRKHLKSKRLTSVRQIGKDRIIVFTFSDGLYHLVFEFFSKGNVILLDSERKVLFTQRIVDDHECNVGDVYQLLSDIIIGKEETEDKKFTANVILSWIDDMELKLQKQQKASCDSKVKIPSIHKLLFLNAPYLSSELILKYLKLNHIEASDPCLKFKGDVEKLASVLNETEAEVKTLLTTNNDDFKGYIVCKKNPLFRQDVDSPELEYLYDRFEPFKPILRDEDTAENSIWKIEEVPGPYNMTVDKFFSTIESSRYELKIQQQEQHAAKVIENAKRANDTRIQKFVDNQKLSELKGSVIINNSDLVESCKGAVLSLVDQQMDWNAIEQLIKSEKAKKNPIAMLIKLPLDLKNNKINILLPNIDAESETELDSDTDDETLNKKDNASGSIEVNIDLELSAFANASRYFNIKKENRTKQSKIEKNQKMALKNIERKVTKDLHHKLKEQHDVLKRLRNPYFFEKYYWFISTEGYLVMMGKSDQETDQIYSKYITDEDIYITCNDVGSAKRAPRAFIINHTKDEAIPPNTLMQAGVLIISASDAWSKKVSGVASWWCKCKNISKFDPHDKNRVLESGSFSILDEGGKGYLAPVQMVMGLAFMWKVKTHESDGIYIKEEDGIQEADEEDKGTQDLHVAQEKEQINTNKHHAEELEEGKSFAGSDKPEIGEYKNNAYLPSPSKSDSTTLAATEVLELNKNVRGKRGKLKKIQKKYADQDEEEKMLRLDALGTLKGIAKEQEKMNDKLQREHKREMKKEVRSKKLQLQALRFTENEKVTVFYDKIFAELKPKLENPNDLENLESIIPVFAPWSALNKYKYKVKILPGTGKKLKSINEILSYFLKRKVDPNSTDKDVDWEKEHELIKQLKDTELLPLLCVDKIKINIPSANNGQKGNNGTGIGKNSKKNKKKK
ncbi:Rqc2p SCDLUD_000706 [Saccharomycodes ludwigii]|uniref:Rqc2p n=1 Tax=Saccharomycodes ludwigii TaxID=36035 RepID=UPI001E8390BC|nr:hypothetical protein SCDLUD_000706 [Saccharomycodes ludwigii]KAH3903094.1 hypothetical protein SCDLUD_000706 [Saccharomycodes ludwigii]